ncbi:MAG: DUF1993 family protein [Pseudomonadales bacterium]
MNLYDIAVPKFSRSLKAMGAVLAKGEVHAEANKIDPSVLINARLYPDMFPLKKQVQIAVDSARRGCGQITGKEVPEIADTEETFAELIARVDTAIAYVEAFTPEDFNGSEDLEIELPLSTGSIKLSGTDFLMGFAMANFSFHYVTAYNILRHNGVALGKMDYLGTP